MWQSLLLLLTLTITFQLSIPLSSQRDRCMVVYTTDPEDFLKLDIKFKKFRGQTPTDGYRIILTNT